MKKTIKIGTRKSLLALIQTDIVKQKLEKAFPEHSFEIVKIDTKGDQILDKSLTSFGGKGVFTAELEAELLSGAIDIAGEVADLKLGNPYISSTPEERDYIESPYSCTSTIDFADNIRSIQHAYCGAQAGDYSISNYVYRQDAELDANVRKAIEEAIVAIEAIEDFENTAQGNPLVKTAIEKVQALEEVLDDEVLPLLSK